MRLGELRERELRQRLAGPGLRLRLHPFVAALTTDGCDIASSLAQLYSAFSLASETEFVDFHVRLRGAGGLRRWFNPKVYFDFDGHSTFNPLPRNHAAPMLEWGLNWCVAAHAHRFLIIHAAVLEQGGRAVLMPAPAGSGKSTLCAGLALSGWRLLSDELALIDLDSGLVHPMARPISLKNASIDVVRRLAPDAILTQPIHDTAKGTVALLRPPDASVQRACEPARIDWIVRPSYRPGASPSFSESSKAQTLMLIADQSFNYDVHGRRGFEVAARLVDSSHCLDFEYGDLGAAQKAFAGLTDAP